VTLTKQAKQSKQVGFISIKYDLELNVKTILTAENFYD